MTGPTLTGQVALITGASGGLGRRFAQLLARHGARVAVVGRRQDALDATLAAVRADGGDGATFACDLARADAVAALPERVQAALGLPTILINNAGIPDARRAHKMPLDLTSAVIDTNLRAPFILAGAVAARLIAASLPGRIVNIASASAYHYDGNGAALYSTTKAAIIRMTEVLAVEWARHRINVNAIAPGMVRTEMMQGMLDRMGDLGAATPRGRVMAPDELDSSILYLLSPQSGAVTGTILRVDDAQFPR